MKSVKIKINPVNVKADISTKNDIAQIGIDCKVVYSPIDASFINNQIVSKNITENHSRTEITYDRLHFTGLDTAVVHVDVDTDASWNDGYNSGYEDASTEKYEQGVEDGIEDQKSKLTSIVITENGEYHAENGYSDVSVNLDTSAFWQDGYQEGHDFGYSEGEADQKSKITPITITNNGVYQYEHGYNPVTVEVPIPTYKSQDKFVTITENKETLVFPDASYDGLSEVIITTNIPIPSYSSQDKSLVITSNGNQTVLPDTGYDGLSRVDLSINVPSTSPTPTQTKSAVYTSNGTYQVLPDQGYNLSQVDVSVNINTEMYYNAGIIAGIAEQKAKLDSSTFTENGVFQREDGWDEVTVAVDVSTYYDQGYADGSTAGIEYQKSLLDSSTFTINGVYTRTDGWNEITVNVPSTPGGSLQAKTTDASTDAVIVLPDASYYGLSQVTVNPVDASIDPNIIPENIKAGVTILGVDGSLTSINGRLQDKTVDSSTLTQVVTFTSPDYTGLNTVTINPYMLESKTVDSSTSSQTVFPGPNYNGIGQVTINPYVLDNKTVDASTNPLVITSDSSALASVTINGVDASIDPNIIPENIKAGVNILGVTGILTDDTQIDLQDKTVIPSDARIEVTADSSYDGLGTVYVEAAPIYEATVDSSTGVQRFVPTGSYIGFSAVTVNPYTVESKTVDSSTGSQTVLPGSANALSQVTVNPYTVQSKTVDPTTLQQVITPDSSYDALSQVTVNAVDASIDANIQPQNIINGVTILGVTGTYTSHTESAGYEEIYRRLMNL